MFVKEVIEELYSCRVCHDSCLENKVCSPFPEPLIGNWYASFAVIGANPGLSDHYFENIEQYLDYYSNPGKCGLDLNELWQAGYFQAYKSLVNQESTPNDFNRNAAILNIIKCSTESLRISRSALSTARENCIGFLRKQLESMPLKVVLAHGKLACCTLIDMLTHEKGYAALSSSCDIQDLAKKIHTSPNYIDQISKEYVIAENTEGNKSLFLFNKHLSYLGSAVKSLNNNIVEKRKLVNAFIK